LPSQNKKTMLIVDAREAESIDKALKKYKKKFEKAGILRELRDRQAFVKKSVQRRNEILRAAFHEKLKREQLG
jgi:small subunit ribosomal protein S21